MIGATVLVSLLLGCHCAVVVPRQCTGIERASNAFLMPECDTRGVNLHPQYLACEQYGNWKCGRSGIRRAV